MGIDAISSTFSGIPIDWIILGVFAVLAAFISLRSGTGHACTLALSLPLAALFTKLLPSAAFVGGMIPSDPTTEAFLFLGVLVVTCILVSRISASWDGGGGRPIQAALAGVAGTAILVTFWIMTPALDTLWHFGPQIQDLFGESYRFWWLIGSYSVLAFTRNT